MRIDARGRYPARFRLWCACLVLAIMALAAAPWYLRRDPLPRSSNCAEIQCTFDEEMLE
ncbi:hypothetical protein HY633_00835 [Candidatus Uhrbacteria bacterium]|nr:hypothetical protein [Candidatus Uhrbacteria bacterium]